jgi:glycosyltransferase involved in cell wall biosynthesis
VYKKRLDQILVDIAHMTLVDTNETKEFFVDEVGANPATIYPVHHGTDERIFYPREHPDNGQTTIWFHGTYIPLQGVEYIVEAAKLLEDRDIKFVLVGSGQERSRIDAIIDNHDIDNIVQKDWVPYEDLPNGIAQADICLGIFGTTGKTNRVVPNKVYEYMSMGKPVITGDTTAMRRLFEHRKNVLLCNRGDPASIADAITTLLADSQLRVKLGRAAHERYQERFSSEQVGKRLISILKSS